MNVQTPLFYQEPVVVSKQKHAELRLLTDANYAFARKAASVPLLMKEFVSASGSMPVVFVEGEDNVVTAQAILSTTATGNSFVDHDGRWRSGDYIPAYIRRYPFIFANTGNAEAELVLCVDQASPQVVDQGAERYGEAAPLFEGGESSDHAQRALAFCNAYQTDWLETEQFIAELQKMKLLVSKQITLSLPSEDAAERTRRVLKGMLMIDPGRLDQLSEKKFSLLRKVGYLPAIYAHLGSLQRFSKIVF